jgi:hypothetical protein
VHLRNLRLLIFNHLHGCWDLDAETQMHWHHAAGCMGAFDTSCYSTANEPLLNGRVNGCMIKGVSNVPTSHSQSRPRCRLWKHYPTVCIAHLVGPCQHSPNSP